VQVLVVLIIVRWMPVVPLPTAAIRLGAQIVGVAFAAVMVERFGRVVFA
jgi:hypothetical protein